MRAHFLARKQSRKLTTLGFRMKWTQTAGCISLSGACKKVTLKNIIKVERTFAFNKACAVNKACFCVFHEKVSYPFTLWSIGLLFSGLLEKGRHTAPHIDKNKSKVQRYALHQPKNAWYHIPQSRNRFGWFTIPIRVATIIAKLNLVLKIKN